MKFANLAAFTKGKKEEPAEEKEKNVKIEYKQNKRKRSVQKDMC